MSCEQLFSQINVVKSKLRNRLTQDHLIIMSATCMYVHVLTATCRVIRQHSVHCRLNFFFLSRVILSCVCVSWGVFVALNEIVLYCNSSNSDFCECTLYTVHTLLNLCT